MDEPPRPPSEALSPEELQRFVFACAHERHSPTTKRIIDAASYGWVHRFIHDHEDHPDSRPDREDWLDHHDADPGQLGAYFGRVAIRLRNTEGYDYAVSLERYFGDIADSTQLWPMG